MLVAFDFSVHRRAGRAGFGILSLFGSNVDRVLRQEPCPVLFARQLIEREVAGKSEPATVVR